MLTTSVVIPTFNRPDELRVVLRSLVEQTRLPSEVIVCDDGDLGEFPLERELEATGVRCTLHKPTVSGLTESRNAGVACASGEIILFLDDDVKLAPGYVEAVLAAFETPGDRRIGGVGGMARNSKPLTWWRRLRWLIDLVFLNSGAREGRILPSGFATGFGATPFPLRAVTRVDFLVGYSFSFRREVFDAHAFTPGFHTHASGEDQDFSLRVARDYALLFAPDAALDHYESQLMRPGRQNMVRRYLIGRYLLFRDHICRGWYHWPLFGYAVLGYLLTQCGASLFSRNRADRGRFKGALSALAAIATGRVPGRPGGGA